MLVLCVLVWCSEIDFDMEKFVGENIPILVVGTKQVWHSFTMTSFGCGLNMVTWFTGILTGLENLIALNTETAFRGSIKR